MTSVHKKNPSDLFVKVKDLVRTSTRLIETMIKR